MLVLRRIFGKGGDHAAMRWYVQSCFERGQPTNRKGNHAILAAAQDGLTIDPWIYRTGDPPIGRAADQRVATPWNDQR